MDFNRPTNQTSHLHIHDKVKDLRDGSYSVICGLSYSSVELQHVKTNSKGINCRQWYHIDDFNKRFKVLYF